MEKGKMVWLDFDAWYIDSDNNRVLFDTTHEDLAEANGIKQDGMHYGPIPIIVGETPLIKGLEEAILEANVGEEKEIEIPPEKGFGNRDPANIVMVPMNKLLRLPQFQGSDAPMPTVGMDVDFGDRKGTIVYMTSSRARIDFNPKYAGKTLVYKFKIEKVAESPEDYVKGALDMIYGQSDSFGIKISGDSVDIKLPDFVKIDQKWLLQKLRVVSLIRKYTDLKVVRFIEEYVKKEVSAGEGEESTEAKAKEKSEGQEEKEKSSESEGAEEKKKN